MIEEIKENLGTTATEAIDKGADTIKDEMVLPVVKAFAIKIRECAIEKINNIGKSSKKSLKSEKCRVIITSRGILKTNQK